MLQTADADATTATACLPACGSFSCSAAAADAAATDSAADAATTTACGSSFCSAAAAVSVETTAADADADPHGPDLKPLNTIQDARSSVHPDSLSVPRLTIRRTGPVSSVYLFRRSPPGPPGCPLSHFRQDVFSAYSSRRSHRLHFRR